MLEEESSEPLVQKQWQDGIREAGGEIKRREHQLDANVIALEHKKAAGAAAILLQVPPNWKLVVFWSKHSFAISFFKSDEIRMN